MKRLSVIIPTYNMERYLANALDSIVACEQLPLIEVVVVNDGSRDASSQIAHSFADRYPESVRVIDKDNGNYGSTINAALPELQGEYVKILDADDRFDTAALGHFVAELGTVSGVDMVVSPYIEEGRDGAFRCDYDLYGKQRFMPNVVYTFDELLSKEPSMRQFAMHALTYRTAMLREAGYRQSEGISYTDREWAFYPLFSVQTITFTAEPVYMYNTSREGQTMDSRVMMRSIGHLQQVAESMGRYFVTHVDSSLSQQRCRFLRAAVEERIRVIYRLCLIAMPSEMFDCEAFEQRHSRLVQISEDCGIERVVVRQNALLPIDVLARWQRHHRRLPDWLRSLLIWLDGAMVALHRKLFK